MSELAARSLDALAAAVVVVSPEWEVLVWNRAAAELLGVPAADATGLPFSELALAAGSRGESMERLRAAADGEPVPVSCRHRDGSGLPLEITAAAVDPHERRVLLLQPLPPLARPAALTAGLAPDIASRLRHDLLGSLNALFGFALLLRHGEAGDLPPLAREMVEDMVAAAVQVQELVDNALAPTAREAPP